MPELILKFNLPEEQNEADITTSAMGMFSAIHYFKEELRSRLEHGNFNDKEREFLDSISELFYEALDDNNVLKLF